MWQVGVLVEQRVEERDAGLADARVAVDERDLAQLADEVVDLELAAYRVGAVSMP